MPLDTLPPDILRVITHSLPTGSVASLALCNKNIWGKIGTQSWKDLSNWRQSLRPGDAYRLRQDKVALLTSLQLGLTDSIYCHGCEKLCHRNGHNPNNRSHSCIKATGIVDLVYEQGDPGTGAPNKVFSLAFLNLQLLMSRYRSLCREISQEHQLSDSRLTELLKNLRMVAYFRMGDLGKCVTSAKVVDDELLFRMETQVLLANPKDFGKIQMYLPETYQHVSTRRDIYWPSNMDWWAQPKWEKLVVYQTHSGVPWRCAHCYTEYLAIVHKKAKSEDYLVKIFVWKNLGSFRSSSDEKWQSHLSHGDTEEHRDIEEPFVKPVVNHGVIYHLFESAGQEDTVNAGEGWLNPGGKKIGRSVFHSFCSQATRKYFDSNLARKS